MPKRLVAVALAAGVLALQPLPPALAQGGEPDAGVVDRFDDLSAWQVLPSDGVRASISPAEGSSGGRSMRIDYDFEAGSGFVIVRRAVDLPMPANYRFAFDVRGEGPANNFEFKLLDPSGDNVWWVNRRAYEWPREWTPVTYRARHFSFAWGPSGGKPHERVAAVEFAIAASEGGRGSVWVDDLRFEELPPPEPVTHDPVVRPLGDGGGEGERGYTIDFRQRREFGGVTLRWDAASRPTAYRVLVETRPGVFEPALSVEGAAGGRDDLPLPDGEGVGLRIVLDGDAQQGRGLVGADVLPVEAGATRNAFLKAVAAEHPRGIFPRPFLNEQCYWTVVGVPRDAKEGLISETGAIEVDKGAFTLEPFLVLFEREEDGLLRLVTWADAEISHTLLNRYLPIPTATWRIGDLELAITAAAVGEAGRSELVARYTLRNTGSRTAGGSLVLAARPFQVLPPWQDLNISGGHAPIERIGVGADGLRVDGRRVFWTRTPESAGATSFVEGEAGTRLRTLVDGGSGGLPDGRDVSDPLRLASATMDFGFILAPGEEQTISLVVPFHAEGPLSRAVREAGDETAAEALVTAAVDAAAEEWSGLLERVRLRLPPEANGRAIEEAFRTTQAYVLINADGPAIQPGSRTYERSWIRDGSLTGTALLFTGHTELVGDFIRWYAPYQYESGKVPCVVDRRGPDPVPEHDSHGQLIYALWKHAKFTGDTALLQEMYPRVVAAVEYIEYLRAQRMTDEYRHGTPIQQACYGLVPESISHEGYSAKPMHSYWDGFFVLKGLWDAASIAKELGHHADAQRFAALAADYRAAMYASMRRAMDIAGIDYIPGCVELGDFDATSTTIGIYPCGELGHIPEPELHNTFERYWSFFQKRRDGTAEWKDYTPYEWRIVGTYVLLGQPERAHALADWFMTHRRPEGWNAWGEIVWRDERAPRFVGDIPHTWVGSDFLAAVRNMLVHERPEDGALVLAAGVRPEWANGEGGVEIAGFPTEAGPVSYTMRAEGRRLNVDLLTGARVPRGGIVVRSPLPGRIVRATIDGREAEVRGGEVIVRQPAGRLVIEHAPRW